MVGDTRDGYHDYAVLNDSQQEVLVYNGRSDGPPYVIALTCPLGIAQYGGFGSSGDGGKNIIGTSSVPDFVIGAPMCNLHPVENHNQGAIYIIDGDTLSVTEWKLPDDETNLWFGRVVHLMRDYSAIPDGRVESSWAQMTGSALKIRLHKGDQELVTSSILRQPHRTL